MSALSAVVEGFNYLLQPVAPFTWFGLGISTLDVAAAFRLCLALRQIKEILYRQHVETQSQDSTEDISLARSVSTTLTVVYGGEAMAGAMLGFPPSFMISATYPFLYAAAQSIVDSLPSVPEPSIHLELPLALFDGFSRAFLLCNLVPPTVTDNTSSLVSSSPWTLLLASLITTNGGFFLTNMFSFLNPTPLQLQTPPELQPYGWTTTDLWSAPLVTGLYALLTHAQPFWAEAHALITALLGGAYLEFDAVNGKQQLLQGPPPVDPGVARAACAMVLAGLFTARAVKNYANVLDGPAVKDMKGSTKEKKI